MQSRLEKQAFQEDYIINRGLQIATKMKARKLQSRVEKQAFQDGDWQWIITLKEPLSCFEIDQSCNPA